MASSEVSAHANGSGTDDAEESSSLPAPRAFVPAKRNVIELSDLAGLEKLTVASYNVLSQMGARRLQRADMGYVDLTILNAVRRRRILLQCALFLDVDWVSKCWH